MSVKATATDLLAGAVEGGMADPLSPEAWAIARIRELHAEYSNALEVPRYRICSILSDLDREQAAQP